MGSAPKSLIQTSDPPTLDYVFRISPQKKENIWGLQGLGEIWGSLLATNRES